MQFLVIAYDGKDAAAASRRTAARPAHLEGANHLNKAGNIIIGGAILNENNEMIGSTLCVDFNTREELDEWLSEDPYVTEGVWQDITVQPIRLAITPS
ncbi:YciI family protein [Gammaproteobacteria bacterium]|uniref:YCII-related domain-containing protein n=1 Tax=OM182 bacterium MED-G28 TaxID=1986256 RepID=A0A2A5W903_9GAMM|nr:hypothetical protein [Gammaproteobacteria bacterium]MDC0220358.1 YciI family protein [Gammaproteobacteria bacterium]PDH32774.1 MAG: hypothetical protein CNF02_10965 [OM182 bacterium MED-G28]|tara:strand:- start:271 stop:564 length:294 start_codon:yes stop_codon:yes gene_type:complete